ncbi:MAG: hypothetical protein P0Y56_00885 [Candidatus Andeanibacterium colombiense]|uniref:Uncharacterized protein n=1 Tax=Candidatus Andeanibacterium colombiense TaxID=3121345 RepID=A0AAJ5X6R9_9SPHN|nr:MAG: hypothetical protein P0Y56_00885 [Sphingomonadaceae bacterium]
MPDEEKPETKAAPVSGSFEEIKQLYGLDTDRKWSNSVQIFYEHPASTVLVVFRETIKAVGVTEDGTETPEQNILGKNVASLILPLDTALSLGKILVENLSQFKDG